MYYSNISNIKLADINKDRKFVLLSLKWTRGSLIFWGKLTEDSQERSFYGYTDLIDQCERFSLVDLEKVKEYEFYKYKGESLSSLDSYDTNGTWIIHVDDLEKLGTLVSHYLVE